jgi:hypothetical protein
LVVASPESATRGDCTTGVVLFDGPLDIVGVVGMTLIVAGVVLLTVVCVVVGRLVLPTAHCQHRGDATRPDTADASEGHGTRLHQSLQH